jgi:hypothetical protein
MNFTKAVAGANCSAMESDTIQKNGVSSKYLQTGKINLFTLFALLISILAFSSCEKDDKGGGSIVGKWKLTDIKIISLKINGVAASSEMLKMYETVLKEDMLKNAAMMEFTADGKAISDGNEDTYSTSGNKLTLVENGETSEYTYSVKGNTLEINMTQIETEEDMKIETVVSIICTRQ